MLVLAECEKVSVVTGGVGVGSHFRGNGKPETCTATAYYRGTRYGLIETEDDVEHAPAIPEMRESLC